MSNILKLVPISLLLSNALCNPARNGSVSSSPVEVGLIWGLSSVPSGGNGESMFELYNSSNTQIGRYGRILYYWVNNSSPYNGVSPCGTFIMAPNDYIKFIIYCNGVTWTMSGGAGVPGEYNNLIIAQIP